MQFSSQLMIPHLFFFSKDFIYLFEREREERQRERETHTLPAEQGARSGAPSQDPEIMT